MAKTQNTLEAVKTKMQELKDARQAQFDTIRKMQETYGAQISAGQRKRGNSSRSGRGICTATRYQTQKAQHWTR